MCAPPPPTPATDNCEDPNTILDESTGLCAPPPPTPATDNCEDPNTILDETTGQCISVVNQTEVNATDPIVDTVCEDPNTILDESTGLCAPILEQTANIPDPIPGTGCEDSSAIFDETTGVCALSSTTTDFVTNTIVLSSFNVSGKLNSKEEYPIENFILENYQCKKLK